MVSFSCSRIHPLASLLLLLGCGAPAATESPDTPTRPSSPAVVAPTAQPTPLALSEALAIGDLSTLKPPADATRTDIEPHSFSYSAPVTPQRTLDANVSDLQAQLAAAGWKLLAGIEPTRNEHGAMEYYEKQGVLLVLAIGKSRGYAPGTTELSGEDVNVAAMLLGNIDARTLTLPPDAKLESAHPDSQSYVTALDPLAIRKFFKTELPKQGWIEFSRPDIPGFERPMEEKAKEQAFLQNGVKLELNYRPSEQTDEKQTAVFARLGLVRQQLPIPAGAKSVEFGDDPPYLSCFANLTLEEAKEFFTAEMPNYGWKLSTPISKEPADVVLAFTAPDRPPVWLGISKSAAGVFLQLKQDRDQ